MKNAFNLLIAFSCWLVIEIFFCIPSAFAFDIAVYNDSRSIINSIDGSNWNAGNCSRNSAINLISNKDQMIQWLDSMGVTHVKVDYMDQADYDAYPAGAHARLLNWICPNNGFRYVESQYRLINVSYQGMNSVDTLISKGPYTICYPWLGDSVYATGASFVNILGDSASYPHDIWLPTATALGKWDGWNEWGRYQPRSDMNMIYMPMHFKITCDFVPAETGHDTVATFYWMFQGRHIIGNDTLLGWWQCPPKVVTRDMFPRPGSRFEVIEHDYYPLLDSCRFLNEDFSATDFYQDSLAFGNNVPVAMRIHYAGVHDFFLYRVEAYDEGYWELFVSPDSLQYQQDSIVTPWRAQYDYRSGIQAGWYYDEFNPDANTMKGFVGLNRILHQNGLPPIYMNGIEGSKVGMPSDTAWLPDGRNLLFAQEDSQSVHLSAHMTEFYFIGGGHCVPNSNWYSEHPIQYLYTNESSDVPYITTSLCDSQSLPGSPPQPRWDGERSLQCSIDGWVFNQRPIYSVTGSPPPPPNDWGVALNLPLYNPSLYHQTALVHSHGEKMWALLQGEQDRAPGDTEAPDNCCPIRTPTPNEIKLEAWLAVACDVDGIMWYPFRPGGGMFAFNPPQPWIDEDVPVWLCTQKRVIKTARYDSAKVVCNEIQQIAPILESLDFMKTYASRAFERNYGDTTAEWIARDILHGSCSVDYIKTYAPINSVITPTSNIIWSSEPELNSYVQISRFMTPGVSDDSEDYWFLIVNRRALSNEMRKIKIGIDSLSENNGTYITQRLLDGTSAPTSAYGTGNTSRCFELILDPGDAELVHFTKMDTTDLVYNDGASHTLLAPLYLNRNIVVRNAKLVIEPNMAAIMDSFWVNGTLHYKYDSTANICFGPGKGIIIEDGNPSHRDPDESKLLIIGNDTTRIEFRPLFDNQKWAGIHLREGTRDSLYMKHVNLIGADIGINLQSSTLPDYINSSYVMIDSCNVSKCNKGLSLLSGIRASVNHSSFTNNLTGILCANNSNLYVQSSTISYNSSQGIAMYGRANAHIVSSRITGNCKDTEENPYHGGITVLSSTAMFKCCTIDSNYNPGIYAGNGSTIVLGDPSVINPRWGMNHIAANDAIDSVQIYAVAGSTLILDRGQNFIKGGTAGKWIDAPAPDTTSSLRYWRRNYWGGIPRDTLFSRHYLPPVIIDPVASSWNGCSTSSDPFENTPISIYNHGLERISIEDFAEARAEFMDVVSVDPNSQLVSGAINGILSADVLAEQPDSSQNYFQSVVDTAQSSYLKRSAKTALAWSYAYSGLTDSAEIVIQDLLSSATSDTQKVESKIDLVLLNLTKKNLDTTSYVSSQDVQAAMDSIESLLASLRIWNQPEITDSVVMYAPCTVNEGISIQQGGVLTILPLPGIKNPVVSFKNNTMIDLQQRYYSFLPMSKLYVRGEPDNHVILEWDSSCNYTNIQNCGYMDLKHATLRGYGFACNSLHMLTWEDAPVFKADSCLIQSLGEGLWMWGTDSTSYLRNSLIEGVGGGGLDPGSLGLGTSLTVFDHGGVTIENCEIRNSGDIGILDFYNDANLVIKNSKIKGSIDCGILSWEGANLRLECNEISDNGDSLPELWVDGGLVDLVGGHNEFYDSTGTLIYTADPSFVDMEDGENSFSLLSQNGHYLQSGDTSEVWDITLNTWSPTLPTDSSFYSYLYPSNYAKWTVDSSIANFLACGTQGMTSLGSAGFLVTTGSDDRGMLSVDEDNNSGSTASLSLLKSNDKAETSKSVLSRKAEVKGSSLSRKIINRAALKKQHNEELAKWREVKDLTKTAGKAEAVNANIKFLNEHPNSELVPAALVSLASLAHGDGKTLGISELLMQKSSELSDHSVKLLAQRLSYKAKAEEGKPEAALAGLEEMMETAKSPRDSIRALVDAMGVYFFNKEHQTLQPRHSQVVNNDAHSLVKRVVKLAKIMNNPELLSAERPVILPSNYMLYQNYPNPFNPMTEIKFDIPEAVKVELKIYNILGQEVNTLINDVRPAGAYRVFWDSKNAGGSSVASGVYVYQLKAGNFTNAKKMVLMR